MIWYRIVIVKYRTVEYRKVWYGDVKFAIVANS